MLLGKNIKKSEKCRELLSWWLNAVADQAVREMNWVRNKQPEKADYWEAASFWKLGENKTKEAIILIAQCNIILESNLVLYNRICIWGKNQLFLSFWENNTGN